MSPVFAFDDARGSEFSRRSMMLAFGVGLVLALGSSGSIVLERLLGSGSARFAFASSVLIAGLSSLLFSLTFRSHAAVFVFGTTRFRTGRRSHPRDRRSRERLAWAKRYGWCRT